MATTSMLHIRIDDSLKQEAGLALEAMGLSLSDAVRLLLKRVVNDQAWPLELKVPNIETQAAMREARAMAQARSAMLRDSTELFAALDMPLAVVSKSVARKPRAAPARGKATRI
jgi:DNA-damage-inducible protein J